MRIAFPASSKATVGNISESPSSEGRSHEWPARLLVVPALKVSAHASTASPLGATPIENESAVKGGPSSAEGASQPPGEESPAAAVPTKRTPATAPAATPPPKGKKEK